MLECPRDLHAGDGPPHGSTAAWRAVEAAADEVNVLCRMMTDGCDRCSTFSDVVRAASTKPKEGRTNYDNQADDVDNPVRFLSSCRVHRETSLRGKRVDGL
jgi:hypothetical protein